MRPRPAITLQAALLMLGLMLGGPMRPAALEAAQPDSGATTVEMAEGFGPAGATVVVPIDLKSAAGIEPGRIALQVTFPDSVVAYQRAVLSASAERGGATLKASARHEPSGETTVDIEIAASTDRGSRRAIPDGQIGHVVVKINETAAPDTEVPLKPIVTVKRLDDDSVVPVLAPPTRVVVKPPPVFSCFFYMH